MKINFKTILIIFLVGLLGGAVGTYGTTIIMDKYKLNPIEKESSSIEQIEYSEHELSDYSKAVEKAFSTVVEIKCQSINSTSAGSGVIISEDGYIITNNHVVSGANIITVILEDGQEYQAQLIGTDIRSDIGVIKIEASGLKYSKFADSTQLTLGENVIAIGNPLGEGICVSDGIISSLEKKVTINNVTLSLLQTSAAVNEGNSGGGLFDLEGNIVGIVNAKSSSSSSGSIFYEASATVEGMGYAVPSNTAHQIATDLIDYGYVKNRATLGIKVYTYANDYYMNSSSGVLISEVLDGGAADKAGLLVGDTIVAVDENEVSDYSSLTNILNGYTVGDKVVVTVYRNGRPLTFNLTLQEATN